MTKFQAHEHNGNLYSGIDIRVSADPRDINQDRVSLSRYKDTKPWCHQYVLTLPAVVGTHWLDREDYDEDEECEAIKKGYKITMVSYLGKRKNNETEEEKEQKKKRFLLNVMDADGNPMKLSDKPFVPDPLPKGEKPATDVMLVRPNYLSTYYETGNKVDGEAVENIASVVSWRFCDMGSAQPIAQTDDDVAVGAARVNEKLEARKKKKAAARKAKQEGSH